MTCLLGKTNRIEYGTDRRNSGSLPPAQEQPAGLALLDLNEEAAQSFADEITAEGGVAKAYKCNVLDKAVCYEVADAVEKDFGKCDILVNGAGGNNPRATTDKEYFEEGDIDADTKSFFDLELPAWSSCSTSTSWVR